MPIVLNGSGTVTGISAGGLPDGIIQAADLASGVGGKIVNYAVTYKTDTASSDVGYPTRTGDLIFLDYAASSSNNKLLIMANLSISNQHSNRTYGELYIGGSIVTASLADASSSRGRSSFVAQPNNDDEKIILMHHNYLHGGSGATATSTTRYSYRFFHENTTARTVYLNRSHNDSDTGVAARSTSSIIILEVAA